MNQTIRIKKGLDVPLGDEVQRTIVDARTIERYAVKPTDMVGFTPRLLVGDGDTVAAGQPLMADKNDPRITLPSPVDGVVEAIIRGEKRKLMEVVVNSEFGKLNYEKADASDSEFVSQSNVTIDLLESLGASEKPVVYVFNKC